MAVLDLEAVRDWLIAEFKPIDGDTVASVLTLTFDPSLIGETWTVTDGDEETYTGSVDASLTAVVKLKQLETTYTITCGDCEKSIQVGYYFMPFEKVIAPSSIATQGLVIYYDALDNTGSGHDDNATSWADKSGNGNNGAISNGAWGADYLQFNGSSTWVNCGQRNFGVVTVEALVSFSTLASSAYADEVCSNFESGGYGLTNHNGKYCFTAYVGGYQFVDAMTSATNTWVHLTGVFDGSSLKIYVNGVLSGTLSAAGSIGTPGSNTVLALGGNPSGSSVTGDRFTGKMRMFRLYNRALTGEEVAENYAHDHNYYS